MNIPLIELYRIKSRLIKEGMEDEPLMEDILNAISEKEKSIFEDTSATGGSSVGGMGAVVSAQPSSLAGTTIGVNWSSGGGTVGSGDISFPYNPSGANRMFQKIPAMGYNHGSRTGKKTRKKRMTVKSMKDIFSKKQDYTKGSERKAKIMKFDDFVKDDITKVKR
jgi:hypothetical protein